MSMYKITGVKTLKNFEILLKEELDYVFFDIEETIFLQNFYFDALSSNYYNRLFLKLTEGLSGEKRSAVKSLGYQFERFLTDNRLPNLINNLKEKNIKVFALTSGFFSESREYQLKKNNIFFDEIVYADGQLKGPILLKYIKKNNINGNIAVVDNHLSKILNIKAMADQEKINMKLFWYNVKFNTIIKKEKFTKDFIDYWKKVINTIKV